MEIEMNPHQAAELARLIQEQPDRPVTLRQLRRGNAILAELGPEATVLKGYTGDEGGDAA